MNVLDAVAAATGLELDVVRGYAQALAAAEMWPDDDEQVEAKHVAALLVAAMVTPEYVREYGSLPFAEAVWSNALGGPQCSEMLQPGNWFAEHATFGHVLTIAITDDRAGDDPCSGEIRAGNISVGVASGERFAELEVELRLETDLQARGVYSFRLYDVAREDGKMVRRATLPLDVLCDLAAALDGRVVHSVTAGDRPVVLLH